MIFRDEQSFTAALDAYRAFRNAAFDIGNDVASIEGKNIDGFDDGDIALDGHTCAIEWEAWEHGEYSGQRIEFPVAYFWTDDYIVVHRAKIDRDKAEYEQRLRANADEHERRRVALERELYGRLKEKYGA